MPGPMGRPQMGGTKEKLDIKAIKKLLAYCKLYLPAIIIAIIFAVTSAIMQIIGPNKIQELIEIIQDGLTSIDGINMDDFMIIVISLITIYAVGALASYLQQFIMATVTQKTSNRLRRDINDKINLLPLKYFDTTTRGDILSRVTNDVDTISQTLGSTIANLVNAITLFLGVIIMMFYVNWVLALITIGTSIFGFIIMFSFMGISQKYFNKRQMNLGEMNGQIEEVYSNHNVIKSYNAEEEVINKFNKINNELYQNNFKSQFIAGTMHPIMTFAGNLSYALIFIVGIAMVLNGSTSVSFAIIVSFTIYARLFSSPLQTIAQSMSSLQQTSAASNRVFKMLDEEELINEEGKDLVLNNVEGNVEFQNVHFGYEDNKTIINDFSVKLSKGQKVAIVGPTGAGKTTIVNLLMRFYEVNSGDILIDNVSIKDMKRENVRDLFDMILQDTWLFKGTIRQNLVYNKENVSEEELDKVCKAVGLSHFIKTLPNGYDTMLDDTLILSEGQKQQLTIARAMIKDSPLLILDEATSSVDTRTELVIQKAMDELTKGRTSFVIAHRLSTIKNADIILVLKDGDIIEKGTHNELLSLNGFYSELYNSQFKLVE